MNTYRLLQTNGLISYRKHRVSWLARRHAQERKRMLRLWDGARAGGDVERVLNWYRTHDYHDYNTSARHYMLPRCVMQRMPS